MTHLILIALGGIGALFIASCAGAANGPTAADTAFVHDMATTASTTMDMADQARTRTSDPQLRFLAETVHATAVPLVDQLAELGPQLAADGAEGFAHEDAVAHEQESADRAQALRESSDRSFDRTFVRLLSSELRAGEAALRAAQGEATDPRTQALANTAASQWADLMDLVNAA